MTKKFLAEWECIVNEVEGDIVWCDAYSLEDDQSVESWEIVVPGNKWHEGHTFYILKTINE